MRGRAIADLDIPALQQDVSATLATVRVAIAVATVAMVAIAIFAAIATAGGGERVQAR